jgi:hypothetical protein
MADIRKEIDTKIANGATSSQGSGYIWEWERLIGRKEGSKAPKPVTPCSMKAPA